VPTSWIDPSVGSFLQRWAKLTAMFVPICIVLDLLISYLRHIKAPLAFHVGLIIICSILAGLRSVNIARASGKNLKTQ
jgi:hypothetical protein